MWNNKTDIALTAGGAGLLKILSNARLLRYPNAGGTGIDFGNIRLDWHKIRLGGGKTGKDFSLPHVAMPGQNKTLALETNRQMVVRSKIEIMEEEIKKVLGLIDKALQGKLSLDEFYQSWPKVLEENLFYNTVYDDTESAAEHYPSKVHGLYGQQDPADYFRNSYEYKVLLADRKILNLLLSENPSAIDLTEMRDKLLE